MFDSKLTEVRNNGVSPVIGVILMVAITVILAAVIGTFVLGLADDLDQNASAVVQFDENEGTSVTVTVNNVQSADTLDVRVAEGDYDELLYDADGEEGVGNSMTLEEGDDYNSGETLQVIGTLDGSESVIQTYETA